MGIMLIASSGRLPALAFLQPHLVGQLHNAGRRPGTE